MPQIYDKNQAEHLRFISVKFIPKNPQTIKDSRIPSESVRVNDKKQICLSLKKFIGFIFEINF